MCFRFTNVITVYWEQFLILPEVYLIHLSTGEVQGIWLVLICSYDVSLIMFQARSILPSLDVLYLL